MDYRLPDQKYTEAEYLFQTIEMAKSDEEYDVELCATPPPPVDIVDPFSIFSWKVVKRRQRPHRRYTVSHGGGSGGAGGAPPAPPSTPTSLTACGGGGSSTPTPSPTASNNAVSSIADDEHLNSLLYILDYIPPKYIPPKCKKLREQQRTDAELAELFNVVTITGGGSGSGDSSKSSAKLSAADRGICAASRAIRKHEAGTKIFKIHRNPKEFLREQPPLGGGVDDEDSVSAPEYDDDTEQQAKKTWMARLKPSQRVVSSRRQRRWARFEHHERMEAMVDTFDAAMSLNCGSNGSGGGGGTTNGDNNA